jgi:hypothetical protein
LASSSETISVAIELESNAAAVAKGDAEALAALQGRIEEGSAALGNMNKALRLLKGGGDASQATIKKLKEQIATTKATISANTRAFVEGGGSFAKLKQPVESSKGLLEKWVAKLRGLPGPLGQVGAKLGGLGSALAVGAIVGVAAALVAVTAAATAAAAAVFKFGLAAADARRNEELQLEGLSKYQNFWAQMVPGFHRAADSAGFLQTQIDEVAASSALSRDRIAGMQAELYRAGLRSGNLQAALEGLAIAESTQGAEGAAQFKARAIGAALYGQSVKRLSDDIKARLGGIAARQMLSLDVQSRKAHESINALFKDLKIERLLSGLAAITDSFSQSNARGRALKAIIDVLFQPLIDFIDNHSILFKRFFQGIIIGALQLGIVVLKLRNWFLDTFGNSEILKGIDTQRLAVDAGRFAFFALASAVLLTGAAFGLLIGLIGVGVAQIVAVAGAIGYAIGALIDGAKSAVNWFQKTAWVDIGLAIPRGIAAGIKSGVGLAVDAIKGMAESVKNSFLSAMRIRSPSRWGFENALQLPRGISLGYRAGEPMVRTSAARLGDASKQGLLASYAADTAGSAAPMSLPYEQPRGERGAATAKGGDTTVHVAEGAIQVHGVSDPVAAAREAMLLLEERIVHTARAMGAQ